MNNEHKIFDLRFSILDFKSAIGNLKSKIICLSFNGHRPQGYGPLGHLRERSAKGSQSERLLPSRVTVQKETDLLGMMKKGGNL